MKFLEITGGGCGTVEIETDDGREFSINLGEGISGADIRELVDTFNENAATKIEINMGE